MFTNLLTNLKQTLIQPSRNRIKGYRHVKGSRRDSNKLNDALRWMGKQMKEEDDDDDLIYSLVSSFLSLRGRL